MEHQRGASRQSAKGMIRFSIAAFCLALGTAAFTPATAEAVLYELDYVFSPPTGAVAPLGTIILTDLGATVRFQVGNQAGSGSKLDSLYFNFGRADLNPNQLVFSNVSAASGSYQTTLAPTGSSTVAALKADGDGYYDGKFAYQGSNFLGHGQTLSFDLGVVGYDLDTSDFHLFSIPGGGTGTYIMASHIQNASAGNSLWVGTNTAVVPLPAAGWLFVAGVAAVLRAARRVTMVQA